jgi:hypothetical protein
MTHLGQLSDHAKFKGWLSQIATNEARLKAALAALKAFSTASCTASSASAALFRKTLLPSRRTANGSLTLCAPK